MPMHFTQVKEFNLIYWGQDFSPAELFFAKSVSIHHCGTKVPPPIYVYLIRPELSA